MNTFTARAGLPRFRSGLIVLAALATPSAMVFAQQLEEVVVSARKKSESLQEIPVSMVAVSAERLELADVRTLANLDVKLGNVNIGASGGLGSSNAAFYIRGLGTSRNAINQEPAVALYVDDSYYGRSDGALLQILDVDRVEVLRGPQGTLFGRNATAGAIRYITAQPQQDFSSRLQGVMGSYQRQDLKAMVNLPVTQNFALRVNAATLRQQGYVDGVISGLKYGDLDSQAFRVSGLWSRDAWEVGFNSDLARTDTQGAASSLLYVNPDAPFVTSEAGAGFDVTHLELGDPSISYQTANNFYKATNFGSSFKLRWAPSAVSQLTAITTYRSIDADGAYDTDGSPASLFEQEYERDIAAMSQEITFASESGALDWLVGAYFYNEEASDNRIVSFTVNSTDRSSTRIVDPLHTTSAAIFSQASLQFSENWALTAGMRYTHDNKRIVANELNVAGEEKVDSVIREKEWSAFSGRLGVEWQFNKNALAYTSYSRGFRAGGFNDRIRTDLVDNYYGITAFDEEILDSVELGFNSDMLEQKLRLNAAIFYNTFTDMQLGSILPGTARTVVQNAGEAEISGVELDLQYQISKIYSVTVNLALLEADYTELSDEVTAVTLASDFPRAPAMSYHIDMTADYGEWLGYISYGWKDQYRTVVADNDYMLQKSYGLLNLNLDYRVNTDWLLSFYVSNALDEQYWLSGLNLDSGKPMGVQQVEPGRPREFGLKVSYSIK